MASPDVVPNYRDEYNRALTAVVDTAANHPGDGLRALQAALELVLVDREITARKGGFTPAPKR